MSLDIANNNNRSIAVLGGKGAYTHLAALEFFSNSNNTYIACSSFEEILNNVQKGKTYYGVIPIENTTSGGITEVYDLLLNSNLSIVGEQKYTVKHCLVGSNSSSTEDITNIFAHPQASRQCSEKLKELVSAKISLVESTAHALNLVATQTQPNSAAIACKEAASLFGLRVLEDEITNQMENITRFLVLSKSPVIIPLSVECKTSLALSTGQKPGSLAEVLSLFRDAEIPLCKLESRPIPNKPWEQMFHIDLQGNISDLKVKNTFEALSKICLHLEVFGSYPSKDTNE